METESWSSELRDWDWDWDLAQRFGYIFVGIIIGGKLLAHNARHSSQIFAKLIGRNCAIFLSVLDHISSQLAGWPNCC